MVGARVLGENHGRSPAPGNFAEQWVLGRVVLNHYPVQLPAVEHSAWRLRRFPSISPNSLRDEPTR